MRLPSATSLSVCLCSVSQSTSWKSWLRRCIVIVSWIASRLGLDEGKASALVFEVGRKAFHLLGVQTIQPGPVQQPEWHSQTFHLLLCQLQDLSWSLSISGAPNRYVDPVALTFSPTMLPSACGVNCPGTEPSLFLRATWICICASLAA